jgi:hypothetical protein
MATRCWLAAGRGVQSAQEAHLTAGIYYACFFRHSPLPWEPQSAGLPILPVGRLFGFRRLLGQQRFDHCPQLIAHKGFAHASSLSPVL